MRERLEKVALFLFFTMDFRFSDYAMDIGGPGTIASRLNANYNALDSLMHDPFGMGAMAIYTGFGCAEMQKGMDLGRIERLLGHPLTDKEMKALEANSLNAHYTDLRIARAMWRAVGHLEPIKKGMKFLDPSAGSGFFFSSMPGWITDLTSERTEIDIDPFATRILKAIHPETKVLELPFQDAKIEDESQDLVITNVPFGDYGVYDPTLPNFVTASIHNYFICKSLNLLRDRGWLAVITSRFTLDSKDTRVREWIADRARLAACVRLPNTTFQGIAGTQVVTDILFFEKVDGGTINRDWVETEIVKLDEKEARINRQYVQFPKYMLGEPVIAEHGMYGRDQWTLETRSGIGEISYSAFARLTEQLKAFSFVEGKEKAQVVKPKDVWDIPDPDGRVDALKSIHTAFKRLLEVYSEGLEAKDSQHVLNTLYDAYRGKYGLISDKKTEKMMVGNHYYSSLKALEVDGEKAPLFFKNTINQQVVIPENPTAEEALAIALQERGRLDIARVADLLKVDSEEAIILLNGRIYKTPDGSYELASQYLSGNIRKKILEAERAGLTDNVNALKAVMPRPLDADEIFIQIGAAWIPTSVIKDFLDMMGQDSRGNARVEYSRKIGTWSLARSWTANSIAVSHTWGTTWIDLYELTEDLLNQKTTIIYDRVDDKSVVNKERTIAAQMKQEEIQREFQKWVWRDEKRKELLCHIYNTTINIWATQKIDAGFITLPGMASELTPRDYQKDAVARGFFDKNLFLWHPVGFGKTLTTIMACAEQIRVGISRKVLITCPINTIGQWVAQINDAYPGMEVLWGEANSFTPANRAEFLSRIATMDKGFIVIPHSSFKLIPLDAAFVEDIVSGEINDLRFSLTENGIGYAIKKRIQKMIQSKEAKLKNMAFVKRDDGSIIEWGQLGVDALVVDEAHEFKNLERMSRITNVVGLSNSASEKAYDLLMKVRFMQEKGKRIIFLSATPLCNSIAELFTWQKFLAEGQLRASGLEIFDTWVGTYGKKENTVDIKPDGSGFRVVTKFTGFHNLPELTAMVGQFFHVVGKDKITEGIPTLVTNEPIMVAATATSWLREFTQELAVRADLIHQGRPRDDKDNMLVVVGDGRKAALDPRLIDPFNEPDASGKASMLEQIVALIYESTEANKSSQLIFCDLGTPKNRMEDEEEGEEEVFTDVYNSIKANLISAGVKEQEIVFAHEAKTATQKKVLVDKMNAGKIRVCIASTKKMGLGTNAQERLVAIHNLDSPWRPDQLEQRNGRAVRPGNTNKNVFIFNYVTTNSLDGFVWQYILSKARFIDQFTKAGVTARSAGDIGEMVVTAEQMKAIGSGNPLLMEEVRLANELAKLEQGQVSYERGIARLRASIQTIPANIKRAKEQVVVSLKFDAYWNSVKDEPFQMTLNGRTFTEYGKAGDYLNEVVHSHMLGCSMSNKTETKEVGTYKGFAILVKGFASATIPPEVYGSRDDYRFAFETGKTGVATMNSLSYRLKSFGANAEREKETIRKEEAELALCMTEAEKPWEYAERYADGKQKLVAIRLNIAKWDDMTDKEKEAALPAQVETRSFEETLDIIKAHLDVIPPPVPQPKEKEVEVKQIVWDVPLVQMSLF